MKKKIIYISGADTFNVEDVKSAFEEVRSALRLDRDVLLFGVPVDDFEAAVQARETPVADVVADSGYEEDIVETPSVVCETVVSCESVADDTDVEETTKATKKSTSRKSKTKTQPVEQETEVKTEETATAEKSEETPVPILSVLAVNKQINDEAEEDETLGEEAIDFDDEYQEDDEESETQEIQDESDEAEEVEETEDEIEEEIQDDGEDIEIEDVNEDMLNDDMPSKTKEKTFEDLLDITTPLCEDVHQDQPVEEDVIEPTTDDETDEVLKNLANEFADNQDNFLPSKKSSGHGISKLKRVLPFGKQKREDPGIMGDLFGWAGLAANDEEFSMPGFFTGVASKK